MEFRSAVPRRWSVTEVCRSVSASQSIQPNQSESPPTEATLEGLAVGWEYRTPAVVNVRVRHRLVEAICQNVADCHHLIVASAKAF